MTTSFEDRLRASMERGAGSVDVPGPPDLREQAATRSNRRRTQGLVAVLGSAALVAAIVAVPQLVGRRSAEAPPASPSASATMAIRLDDMPVGRPPALPYVQDGQLVGVRLARVPSRGVLARGDALLNLTPAGSWTIRKGGTFVDLPGDVIAPRLSPDGTVLAWFTESGGDVTTVHAYDTRNHREISSHSVEGVGVCCDQPFELLGVDARGFVYWLEPRPGSRTHRVWWPEGGNHGSGQLGTPRKFVLPGPNAWITQVVAQGVVIDGGPDGGVIAKVDPDGQLDVLTPISNAQLSTLSSDGTHVFEPGLWVRPVEGGRGVRMLLDGSLRPQPIGFETDHAVLVRISQDGREGIARCATETGACERAVELDPGSEVSFPR